METSSFASRRPAATSLPAFSLPPPDIPRVTTDGLSPLSSGIHSASSQSSQPGSAPGMYYSSVTGSWPTPVAPSSPYHYSNNGPNTTGTSSLVQPSYASSRPMYPAAPSSVSVPQHFVVPSRPNPSAATANGLSASSYHEPSSALLNPISSAGHSQPHVPSPSPPHQGRPPHGSSTGAQPPHENSYRPPHSASPYYPSSTAAQQPSYPAFGTNAGPQPHPSPNVASAPASSAAPRTASIAGQFASLAPPLSYGPPERPHAPPYPAYHMPGNPVLSNMHHPGAPLAMVSGMGIPPGYGPPAHHHPHPMGIYGHDQPASQQDRPYKCDQCPQCFNRNHDLKRHKRIHLAVKPFPCTFCEKSFSRKDALKRHRLVKGCGGKQSPSGAENSGAGIRGGSPADKSEAVSDDGDGSPNLSRQRIEQ